MFLAMTLCLLAAAACGDDKGDTGIVNPTTMVTTVPVTTLPASTGDTSVESTGAGSSTGTTAEETTAAATTTTTGLEMTTAEATTGTEMTTAMSTDGSTGSTGPGTPLEQCLAMVDLGDECGECACMSCLEQLQACQMDEGCLAIRACAQEFGCTGIDCLVPCMDVYGDHGGPFGNSGMLAQALGSCVYENCPNLCII